MGIIRYPHTSPGVYTKNHSIRLDVVNKDLLYKSTTNIVYNGGGADQPFTVYFGYYPLKSKNGVYTPQILNTLRNVSFSSIVSYSGVNKIVVSGDTFSTDEITIPLNVTEEQLRNRIASGETFSNIADMENNCVVLLIPSYTYSIKTYDITDDTFEVSVKNIFNKIYSTTMDGMIYDLLVMYNNHYAYSRIGSDKIISPITFAK